MTAPSVTELLQRVQAGEFGAHEALAARVQAELRHIARAHLSRAGQGLSIEPTELLNEAYLRLLAVEDPHFSSRQQFFGLVSCIMRGLLADMARRRHSEKRGGRLARAELDLDRLASVPEGGVDLLDLSEALEELARLEPNLARAAELRYIAGFSVREVSEVLNVTVRTTERRLATATAWLRDRLGHDRT